MNRPSARLILIGVTLSVLGSSAAVASADTQPKKDHTVCLINQDGPSGPQQGLCVTLPLK